MNMNVSEHAITREEATAISPDYVAFVENCQPGSEGYMEAWGRVFEKFNALKRGQDVITYHDGQFIKAKVSSVQVNPDGDGPKIRVSTDKFTWRVDGVAYAYPV